MILLDEPQDHSHDIQQAARALYLLRTAQLGANEREQLRGLVRLARLASTEGQA